ncbi:universal stress protein [Kitasatospora sp. NPDC054939]
MTATEGSRPIVLGVDALAPGPLPAAWAADQAAGRGLPLRLVHALPQPSHDARAFDRVGYRREVRERADAALAAASEAVLARHPEVVLSSAVVEDSPARALCAESRHAELVVLGSRRLNRLEEVLSNGSVTVPVSAQSRCPVAVVAEPEQDTGEPRQVVVGVDGSPASASAVAFAFDLASRRGAVVRAVWVWQPPLLFPPDRRTAVESARARLAELTAGYGERHPEVALTHQVLVGHPVEELAQASAEALAVVVGRRGHGGFTGMRLGSVPYGLLHRAHCPVVTVPPARAA